MSTRALIAALALGALAAAQEPDSRSDSTSSTAGLRAFEQDFGPGWTVWSGPNGVPYRVFGPGAEILPSPGVQTVADAREAAERILARHWEWLGVRAQDLRERWSGETFHNVTLQCQQLHQGVPVWNAWVEFTFNKNDGRLCLFGSEAVKGLQVGVVPALSADQALARYRELTGWTPALGTLQDAPALEIAPDDAGTWRLTWVVRGEFTGRPEAWALWVDATTGAEVRRESLVHYCSTCGSEHGPSAHGANGAGAVAASPASPAAPAAAPAAPPALGPLQGNVKGMISPMTGGLTPINPEQLLPMAGVRINVPGVGTTYTDANGDFSLPYTGTTTVPVTLTLPNGRWWSTVTDSSSTALVTANGVLDPAGPPTNFVFNPTPSQYTTAQVNAVKWATEIHDYVKRVVPTMSAIDAPVSITVNINQSCNAYFSGSSINFYRLAGSCNNTATASIVSHEYGHSIDARNGGIGSTPRTPSEGIADVCAMYLLNNPDVGTDFYQSSRPGIRNGGNSLTHPLTGSSQAVHNFGEPFMGWAWDLLQNARATYGAAAGYMIAEKIVFDSIVLNPRDMLDYILKVHVADDDDSNLNNGTPHIDVLAKASLKRHFLREVFRAQAIAHTPLADAVAAPAGLTIDAAVTTKAGNLTSFDLWYDPGTGTFTKSAMVPLGGNNWRGFTPPITAPRVVRYWLEARNDRGNVTRLPAEANDAFVVAVGAKTVHLSDGFEVASTNFTASNTGSNGWVRHQPFGRNYDAYRAASGSFVFGTNQSSTEERFTSSGGTVRLTSRALNLTGVGSVRLRYKRWFHGGSNSGGGVFVNGVSIASVAAIGDGEWRTVDVDVSAQAANRTGVTIVFEFRHGSTDGVGGLAVDDVEVYTLGASCVAAVSYAAGLAGANGVPQLADAGGLPRIANAAYAMQLSSARASAPVAFALGAATASLPLFGGTLAVRPDLVIAATTSAAGTAALPVPLPDDATLIGGTLYLQCAVLDAAATQGLALSNAVATRLCDK